MTLSTRSGCFAVDRRSAGSGRGNMVAVPIGMDFQTIKLKVGLPTDVTRRGVLIVTASYPRARGQYVVFKGSPADEISLRLPKKINDATPKCIFTVEFSTQINF